MSANSTPPMTTDFMRKLLVAGAAVAALSACGSELKPRAPKAEGDKAPDEHPSSPVQDHPVGG